MGFGSFNINNYVSYASATTRNFDGTLRCVREIFKEKEIHPSLDPKNVIVRESRDSDEHPESTPIMLCLDVTGSMGFIPQKMISESLGKLMSGIMSQNVVTDPHILFAGIGDIEYDNFPLQVSQFESDLRIAEQLSLLCVEGGGGGNQHESYDLAWLFAKYFVNADSYKKRGKRGFIFTIGDEYPSTSINLSEMSSRRQDNISYIMKKLQYQPGNYIGNIDTLSILREIEKEWEVFHIIVEEGSHASMYTDETYNQWREILGNRAVRLSNHNYIAEVILACLRISSGNETPETIVDSCEDQVLRGVLMRAFSLQFNSL